MIYSLRIKRGGAPLDAMNFVAALDEKFGEVGAILSSDSSDKCFLQIFLLLKKSLRGYYNHTILVRYSEYTGKISESGDSAEPVRSSTFKLVSRSLKTGITACCPSPSTAVKCFEPISTNGFLIILTMPSRLAKQLKSGRS